MPVTARQRRAPGRGPEPSQRPGIRSRIRPAAGRKRRWRISDSQSFPLPVIVDHLSVDPPSASASGSSRRAGYAQAIAAERGIAERTVVSWVEKARRRGILTKVPAGSNGDEVVPRSHRPAT